MCVYVHFPISKLAKIGICIYFYAFAIFKTSNGLNS